MKKKIYRSRYDVYEFYFTTKKDRDMYDMLFYAIYHEDFNEENEKILDMLDEC